MNKYKISITPAGYKKIHKKLMKYSIKVGGMDIGNFLIANSTIEDLDDPPAIRTKRVIQQIMGDLDGNPEDLNEDLNLRLNLLFGRSEFVLLRKRLELLSREYDKWLKIGSKEIQDCQTIGDCIHLVSLKISQYKSAL